MQVWIVGQYRQETPSGAVWDFQGAFDSEEKAVESCVGPDYFVMPAVTLNTLLPDEQFTAAVVYPKGNAWRGGRS